MARVRFADAAIVDITVIRDWYESECTGLGGRFLDSVELAVGRIAMFPGSGSVVGPNLRRQFLDRFPYVLYYQADLEGVLVIACLHVARGPAHRMRRLSA